MKIYNFSNQVKCKCDDCEDNTEEHDEIYGWGCTVDPFGNFYIVPFDEEEHIYEYTITPEDLFSEPDYYGWPPEREDIASPADLKDDYELLFVDDTDVANYIDGAVKMYVYINKYEQEHSNTDVEYMCRVVYINGYDVTYDNETSEKILKHYIMMRSGLVNTFADFSFDELNIILKHTKYTAEYEYFERSVYILTVYAYSVEGQRYLVEAEIIIDDEGNDIT